MNRVSAIGWGLVIAFVLSATAPAAASAMGFDWTVNEVALTPGESRSIAFEATAPTTITVPKLNLTVICQHFSGTGTITGGEVGTAEITSSEVSECAVGGEPGIPVTETQGICKGRLVVDYRGGPGERYERSEFCYEEVGTRLVIPSGPHEGRYTVKGGVDSNARPVDEGLELEFPESPLPASTLAVNGAPAVFSGVERETVTGGALGLGVLNGSSGPPRYYTCVKSQVEDGGGYRNKTCSTEVGEAGPFDGKYELAAAAGEGKPFTGKGKAITFYVTVGESVQQVTCRSSRMEANYPQTATGVLGPILMTFAKCTREGQSCESTGAKSGEIRFAPLEGSLGYVERATTRVGVALRATEGDELVSFSCDGVEITSEGAVIGELAGDINTFSKTFTLTFAETGAKQAIRAFEGGETEVLESSLNGSGPFESTMQATFAVRGEDLEIKA